MVSFSILYTKKLRLIYSLLYIYIYIYIHVYIFIHISCYIKIDPLRHQKSKNKRLENNFKPINVYIYIYIYIYMDEFEKTELTKKITFIKKTWYDCYDWLIIDILSL